MRTFIKATIAVILMVSIISGSTYAYAAGDHFSKVAFLSLNHGPYSYYVNPFNNSTNKLFTLNFSLDHYAGGPIAFSPGFTVNSTPENLSETNHIMNLTTHRENGTSFSPYYAIFSMEVLISPYTNNPGYGNFNYFQGPAGVTGPMGSTGVGTVVVLWNEFSGDNLTVVMGSINIPQGNYNVSVTLMLYAVQPSQLLLNLTNVRTWVNLTSFEVMSQTTFNGVLDVSNLSVSPGK